MKTLSIWKPVADGFRWAEQGLRSFWRISKFDYFPSEKSLLISFWYDYAHFRRFRPGETVYDFIDLRRRYLETLVDSRNKRRLSTQFFASLLRELDHEQFMRLFITYLESASPEANYRQVLQAVHGEAAVKDGRSNFLTRSRALQVQISMEQTIEIPVEIRGTERVYAGTVQVWQYGFRFLVDVDGVEMKFERDDAGEFRALLPEDFEGKIPDKETILAIIEVLETL